MISTLQFPRAVLAALMALLLAVPAHASEMVLKARQVGAHSWVFIGQAGIANGSNQGFNSNAGFVVTPGGVVVFDTLGTPALGKAMIAAIRRVSAQPVRRVIISHYHADHYYGAQAFKAVGAQIWAHSAGQGVTRSDSAQARLRQRRDDLFPFVDEKTELVDADHWIDFDVQPEQRFTLGGVNMRLINVGGAHAPDDMMMFVENDGVLFAGDVYFTGRLPFVVGANTAKWLQALERMAVLKPRVAVPGHGEPSKAVALDLTLTRDYLRFLRQTMGPAAQEMIDFDTAYARVDWSRWAGVRTFNLANRLNARAVYLEMERESLSR